MATKASPAFDPKVFLAVVGAGKTISNYRRDDIVFAQGDPGDAVFFIERGRVKVTVLSEQGKEAIIAFLGPADFIGEGCLGSRTRQEFIRATNIAHYKALLERETAPDKRKVLLTLLAEEEAKPTSHGKNEPSQEDHAAVGPQS